MNMQRTKYKSTCNNCSSSYFMIMLILSVNISLLLISITAVLVEGEKTDKVTVVKPNEGFCDLENGQKCQKKESNNNNSKNNKYTQKVNLETKFLNLIHQAEQDYESNQQNAAPSFQDLISKDLGPFTKAGITKDMIEKAMKRGILYQIKDHKLYRSQDCNFPARCSGIEHFILELIRDLDDMEFVINVSDYPQNNWFMENPVPVFSFSKTSDYMDIIYPAWTFWEGGPAISIYPRGIGRWDLMRGKLIEAANEYSWEKKFSKGFFRGSRTSNERDPLILLSREEPELVDAQYTKNQAWKSDKDTLGVPAAKEVSFQDHCKFKYLFNFRGVAASFRFKHLFLCNSLVFQVGEEWQEFFYPFLKPWYHYIPVNSQATKEEIRSLIEFAKSQDDLMHKIAQRGFEWIKENLQLKDVREYWKQLLTSYSKLLKYKIEVRKDFKPIY